MAFIDYYKVLGVDKKATETEIKKAYRKMARKHHPDLNPNDKQAELKFKELNEANEVLSNPENRKKYDQYGENWEHGEEYEKSRQNQQRQQQQRQQQSSGSQGGFNGFEGGDYSDFFETMFNQSNSGGGQRRSPQYKGQDFTTELNLTLKDVYTTHKRTLTVNGKNIRITIAAGVENGQVIKISGYGGEGISGGPKGDLYITFSIDNDTNFKRDKDNLFSTVSLDLYTAVLGGDITVNTFDGKAKLNIVAGTQNNTKVKLKGKGFPVYKKDGAFGDLYITYQITIPTHLSDKELELFTELSKIATS